jgi:hypothetical protein
MFMLPPVLFYSGVVREANNLTRQLRVQGLGTSTYWLGNYFYGIIVCGGPLAIVLSVIIHLLLPQFREKILGMDWFVLLSGYIHKFVLAILISAVFQKPISARMISCFLCTVLLSCQLFLGTMKALWQNHTKLVVHFSTICIRKCCCNNFCVLDLNINLVW